MSRAVAWRNKPTPLITQMLPVANEYKLYLVHETGPTSFTFKDDNDNKFKVSIGSTVSCSCNIVQNDHCIHTLYVLLKKYKVPPTNPIIWQAYLDSELEGLVQLKFAEKKKEAPNKHKFKPKPKTITSQQQDFPVLEEDSMCPICYEDMNGQCYSTCKVCRKSLHSKCFKVWTRHKEDSHVPVTCPMCRSQFQNPMMIIHKDFQRWDNRFATHKGSCCKGCGVKNIKGSIFKCLLCSGTELCRLCFDANQHSLHDRYFTKNLANQPWKAINPRKKNKKPLFQANKELTTKELSEFQKQTFILQLFPSLKDYNSSQNTVELGIIGNQILPKQLCFKCKTGGSETNMKRLQCSHAVHEECLLSMLLNKQFICEIDQQIIAPGYFEALGIKVTKKKKNVECVILKNQEAINKMEANIMEIQGFVPTTTSKIPTNKRNASLGQPNRSRDKNFRIMKKTVLQKREEMALTGFGGGLGGIMVTGLGQQQQTGLQGMPPRMKPHLKASNYR